MDTERPQGEEGGKRKVESINPNPKTLAIYKEKDSRFKKTIDTLLSDCL